MKNNLIAKLGIVTLSACLTGCSIKDRGNFVYSPVLHVGTATDGEGYRFNFSVSRKDKSARVETTGWRGLEYMGKEVLEVSDITDTRSHKKFTGFYPNGKKEECEGSDFRTISGAILDKVLGE